MLLRPTSEMCIYYADYHDVDEDVKTITAHGGQWVFTTGAGVAARYMGDRSPTVSHTVAFMCRHPELIKYYTDWHDVDEDKRGILSCGGSWDWENKAGVTFRSLNNTPTYTWDSFDHVASYV